MKIIGIFSVVVTASIALLQPAQGRPQGSARSFSHAHYSSASAGHFSSRPRTFSRGNARFYGSSPRYSSQAAFRNRSLSGPRLANNNRTAAFNPRAYSASGPRLATDRGATLRPRGFNNNQGRVLARHSGNWHQNWDRRRDHYWHGRRCHWQNNAWVIFDPGFYPWNYGWGYYPYGAYSYYDGGYYGGGYYDDGYASNEYSQEPYPAQYEYDRGNGDSIVSQTQAALARQGYYHGAIDGSVGPATRSALRRYQRNHGLDVTGRIDRSVVEALGLR